MPLSIIGCFGQTLSWHIMIYAILLSSPLDLYKDSSFVLPVTTGADPNFQTGLTIVALFPPFEQITSVPALNNWPSSARQVIKDGGQKGPAFVLVFFCLSARLVPVLLSVLSNCHICCWSWWQRGFVFLIFF